MTVHWFRLCVKYSWVFLRAFPRLYTVMATMVVMAVNAVVDVLQTSVWSILSVHMYIRTCNGFRNISPIGSN